MSNLYEIDSGIERILAGVATSDGEITDEQLAELEALEGARTEKWDALLCWMRERESRAEAFHNELERLKGLATSARNQASRIKALVSKSMERAGVEKAELNHFKVHFQSNPPSVQVHMSAEYLPIDYQRIIHTVDKKALLVDWRSGREMPSGVTITQSKSLRIK